METAKAESMARILMDQYGLKDWSFDWTNAKRTFGVCSHSTKTISLSRPLVELNDVQEVRDTILHEIAHGMIPREHGHDLVWRNTCRNIGAKPIRCYDSAFVKEPEAKYQGFCMSCDKYYVAWRQRPGGKYRCSDPNCRDLIVWDVR
jgi:predicted SprT family Zn-dependent metalloprotease